jgi:hypothetical protein
MDFLQPAEESFVEIHRVLLLNQYRGSHFLAVASKYENSGSFVLVLDPVNAGLPPSTYISAS